MSLWPRGIFRYFEFRNATGGKVADILPSGNVRSLGGGAILNFQNRDGTQVWGWYAVGNVARLYNGAADVLRVDSNGALYSNNDFSGGVGLVINRQTKSQGAQANGATTTHTFTNLLGIPLYGIGQVWTLTVLGRNQDTGVRYVGEFKILLSREGADATFTILEARNLLNGVGQSGTAVNISLGISADGTTLSVHVQNATGGGLQANLSLRAEV